MPHGHATAYFRELSPRDETPRAEARMPRGEYISHYASTISPPPFQQKRLDVTISRRRDITIRSIILSNLASRHEHASRY
jgi:hypothetical protein